MPTHVDHVLSPGRGARLAARLLATRLDHQLIDGADPAASPQLAARAAQLTARPERDAIADGLQRLLAGATGRWRRYQVPFSPHAIKANEGELEELAALLRSGRPLYAQGLAILHELVADGTGPAYLRGGAAALTRGLSEARAAL